MGKQEEECLKLPFYGDSMNKVYFNGGLWVGGTSIFVIIQHMMMSKKSNPLLMVNKLVLLNMVNMFVLKRFVYPSYSNQYSKRNISPFNTLLDEKRAKMAEEIYKDELFYLTRNNKDK